MILTNDSVFHAVWEVRGELSESNKAVLDNLHKWHVAGKKPLTEKQTWLLWSLYKRTSTYYYETCVNERD